MALTLYRLGLHSILWLWLWFGILSAWPGQYNIYLSSAKLQPHTVLSDWIDSLCEDKNFDCSQLDFYYPKFPSHITLYLGDFNRENLPKLQSTVARIAGQQQGFCLALSYAQWTPANWLLWHFSLNEDLQALSDTLVLKLAPFRNKAAVIPAWAQQFPSKFAAFQRYGSPNVFFEYQPHFTLAGPKPSSSLPSQEMLQHFSQFVIQHPINQHHWCFDAIALGSADKNGQIRKEWFRFPLQASFQSLADSGSRVLSPAATSKQAGRMAIAH